jgi:iron-sulfur cluster repair protein YtfE (RIC family)
MTDRIVGLGNQLVELHLWLREQLALIRAGGADPRTDLRAHCVAFCTALTRHHTDEDATVFPVLAAEHPSLRPVLDELRRDHVMVAELLGRLSEATDRAELDGLAALLESHFTYEEKRLVAALNGLADGPPVFAHQLEAATSAE